MRRDMELIRAILLKLEAMPMKARTVYSIDFDDDFFVIEGFNFDEVVYHLTLIREAGLTEPHGNQGMSSFTYSGLTWSGHDFVDSVREPEIWQKTKSAMHKAGSFTVDLMIAAAKEFAKQKLKEVIGLELG